MSNVLTALAPVLYGDGRLVPSEAVGFLGAVDRRWNDQGVALNDSVKIPVVPIGSVTTISPGATFPTGSDTTPTTKTLVLDGSADYSFHLGAEEERSLENGGTNAIQFLKQNIAQGTRAIRNQIEAAVGTLADISASRAYGTAGTTPFASTLAAAAQVRKILLDNGCPMVDLGMVMDSNAGVALRSLTQLTNVNQAGSADMLRRGSLGSLFDMEMAESAGVASHTAGTGTGYLINNGNTAKGSTVLTVDTGSGTVLPGDVIAIGSGADKYVVVSSVGGGTVTSITIQEPGLRVAIANNDTVSDPANHTANIALHRNAIVSVVRPALQPNGALAEQMTLSDPKTGLSFLLLRVPQNGQVSWFVRCVYGQFAPNAFGIAKLLG